jgi:tetratricopeptide (TPR) repeat protein
MEEEVFGKIDGYDNDNMVHTLCLNMIVKNESKIIVRLLESVAPFIDSYCICDTGSTDNTEQIITDFFCKRGIPGIIIHEPFRDFGYNRSYSLNACSQWSTSEQGKGLADFVLLLDADMLLRNESNLTPQQVKQMLTKDMYFIFQGNEFHYYKNVRIVRNGMGFYYWGVTHEYVASPPGVEVTALQLDRNVLFIYDVGDGGSKTNKFSRDIELLKGGLRELPNNERYLFYLANSYRDTQQFELAIETYTHRIEVGGWFEEIWYSHYSIGRCYKLMGQPEKAIIHWLEAYQVFPQRLENIYEIIQYYRLNGKNQLSYQFYRMAEEERKRFTGSLDYLFLEKDVYDWKLDYEFTVLAYYRNSDNYNIRSICMNVLSYPYLEEGVFANILSNYKFYSKNIIPEHSSEFQPVLKELLIQVIKSQPDFVSSTPTFCFDKSGNFISLIRHVNYRIDENGNYINRDTIESKNVISVLSTVSNGNWIKKREFILKHDTSLDNIYVGLEDVRLLYDSSSDNLYYTANRGLSRESIQVEYGTIDMTSGKTVDSVVVDTGSPIEKNWTMFLSGGTVNVVHSWNPLTIGTIKGNRFIVSKQITEVPRFFKSLRGSTNGIQVGNETWFICHIVSYEQRRYYYHLFVAIDTMSFQVTRYTPFFTFTGQPVEYCLGLNLLNNNNLLVGYSIMDRETHHMVIPVDSLDWITT